MDKRQQESIQRYADLLKDGDVDLAVAVGRHSEHLGVGESIWDDITHKLKFKKSATFLDIGCGFGEVTRYSMAATKALDMQLHLLDIEEALDRVKQEMKAEIPPNTTFWNGIFPEASHASYFPQSFDLILVYSVLHYTDQPEEFVEKAVSLLAPGGQLLIGDIPNVQKKGRFLSSETGRRFEAGYQKVALDEVPVYKDQFDFFTQCENQNKKINDDFLSDVVNIYRAKGYHVYVLPQADDLPFCKTREDVLIVRP
jgi:SAM-dependent methyltransferase